MTYFQPLLLHHQGEFSFPFQKAKKKKVFGPECSDLTPKSSRNPL